MVCMAQVHPGELDAAQGTLLITLAARARETRRRLSLLRDPKAVEIVRALGLNMAAYTRGGVGDAPGSSGPATAKPRGST
jgi:O-methyltransferase involved in polyketide biosynthesis